MRPQGRPPTRQARGAYAARGGSAIEDGGGPTLQAPDLAQDSLQATPELGALPLVPLDPLQQGRMRHLQGTDACGHGAGVRASVVRVRTPLACLVSDSWGSSH